MWNNWEQLRSVVHPNLVLALTKEFLYLMESCIVREQFVRKYFAGTKIFFYISTEATINVPNANPCVMCAIFPLKNKQLHFSWKLARELIYLKRKKSIQGVIGVVFCPTWLNEKSVYLSTTKISVLKTVGSEKLAPSSWFFLLRSKTDNYVVWWWWYTLACKKNE